MTPLHALARRLWPLVDWRRHAVLEARGRRGAAAMLDESMRRTVATLRWEREGEERFIPLRPRATDPPSIPLRPLVEGPPGVWVEPEGLPVLDLSSALPLARDGYRLGDSDGTRVHEPEDIARDVEVCPLLWTCADGGKLDCGGCNGDGTRTIRHPLPGPADGEAVPPPTTRTVPRETLLRRAREASQGGADYLPPWEGEGL